MIEINKFIKELQINQIHYYFGVPDSLLSALSAYLQDELEENHIIAANEGNAVGLAVGNYLATGLVPVVYMQNSGLGNAINPLCSLVDPKIYSIPMLLIIGYRGEPGIADEPQHVKQGEITLKQLELLDIDYEIIDSKSNYKSKLSNICMHIKSKSRAGAIVIRNNAFNKYASKNGLNNKNIVDRESALDIILKHTNDNDLIISTTGKTSRELFELRVKNNQVNADFLTVGGMGHASSIALGVALIKKNKRIFCIDGDGSMIMHLGSSAIIGSLAPKNFIHVLINNECHESVGGQPTVGGEFNFHKFSESCNYSKYFVCRSTNETLECLSKIDEIEGPILIEIKCTSKSRSDLGRPNISPINNRNNFINKMH